MARAPKPGTRPEPVAPLADRGVRLLRPVSLDEPFVEVVISETEMLQVPCEIAAAVTGDGLEVELLLGVDDELLHVVRELRVRSLAGGGLPAGAVARTLRAFGVPKAIDRVIDRAAWRWVASQDGRRWVFNPFESFYVENAHRTFRPRGRKRGSEAIAAEVEQAARLYNDAVRAGLRAPVECVRDGMRDADGFPPSRRTVQRRLEVARARGLIDQEGT